MKANVHKFAYHCLLPILLTLPFTSYCQITKRQAKKEENIRVNQERPEANPFYFAPGRDQRVEITFVPKPGLFHVKLDWDGTAGELKCSLISKTSYASTYVTAQGRSPLYISHLVVEKPRKIKANWFIRIENLHPDLTAKGIATVYYTEELDSLAKSQSQAEDAGSNGQLSYHVFINLDRSAWGEAHKDFRENGDIYVQYANGNWVLQQGNQTFFFDAQKKIKYKVVKEASSRPHVRLDVQTPAEPPAPYLFTGEADTWRNQVEAWVNSYSIDLLNEIKELMDNDSELIEKYMATERKRELKLFGVLESRANLLKKLQTIYKE